MKVKLSDIVLDSFKDFWKASKSNEYLYYVLKGGRSSAKSSHISLRGIIEIANKPVNGLVVRKHAKYLRESVFEQLKWAANELGIAHFFKFQVSPMQIIYKPRGNKILFAGADDPERIKGIANGEFPYTWLWIEELAEFKDKDEVETIVNSIIREETDYDYKIFYSYNPPKKKSNWCNKKFESITLPDIYFVHHSDYRDNPYISEQTLRKIKILKEEDEHKYKHVWLGEPIGSGVVPFSNLEFREITDEEINSFDNIRQGIDWGYAADPFCFLRMHYDRTRKKLYIFDELMEVQLSNRKAAKWIKEKGYNDIRIIADSEEPKSIAEMKEYGIRIKGAKKGPGSVEYGEKWLNDLNAIIIDPDRAPKTANEYENIDYATDKDGNIKNRLEDKNNHSIDTTRYACEDDMSKGGTTFLT